MSERPLTRTEIALCETVFGQAIDYDLVRIFNRKWWPFQPKRITMAPDGNLWFHPENDLFRADFAEAELHLQGLFIHEMVHVWQHQNGVFLPLARHPFCRYDYELVIDKPFGKYNVEQQAEIVRHIFLLRNGAQLQSGLVLADLESLDPFMLAPVTV
jgi:hypothetical protein